MTKREQKQTIDKVSKLLTKHYILSDEGNEMSKVVQTNLENGKYDTISSKFTFSEQLTSDMRSIFPDKHLALVYKPWAQMKRDSIKNTQVISKTQILESRILQDNIGYLVITSFTFKLSDWDRAMSKLSKCDALIIDVRNNGGGSGHLENYAISYFLQGGLHYSTTYITERVRNIKV
ncbi:MAG: S41 family peptidase [Bacteroidota bacterium]